MANPDKPDAAGKGGMMADDDKLATIAVLADVEGFIHLLRMLEDGDLVAHLDAELGELVSAVHDDGRADKGQLDLRLKVEKVGDRLLVAAQIVNKMPGRKRGATSLWLAPDGTLVGKDPNQTELEV